MENSLGALEKEFRGERSTPVMQNLARHNPANTSRVLYMEIANKWGTPTVFIFSNSKNTKL